MKSSFPFVCLLLLGTAATVQGSTPWLPAKGHGSVTGLYSNEKSYRIIRANGVAGAPSASPWENQLYLSHVEYGLGSEFALDVTGGYVRSTKGPTNPPITGRFDTIIGARWRLLDEFTQPDNPWMVSAAVRVAAIIAGDYLVRDGVSYSPGRGTSGTETGLLLARVFGRTGLALNAEAGYRYYEGRVPDEKFYAASLSWRPLRWISFDGGFQHADNTSGLDLDASLKGRYTLLNETANLATFSVGVNLGPRFAATFYGTETLSARNTGDKATRGFALTYAF